METKWGMKEADIREGIYRDIVGIYTHDGIASDETMKNVIQLVRDTRKSKDNLGLSDIVDWSFAKKAQAELKTSGIIRCSCFVIVLGFFGSPRIRATNTDYDPSFLKNPSFSSSSSKE